jgi:predicted transcriptional regulator
METLIIGNQSRREIRERIVAAWKTGKAEHAARVDFPDTSVAWKVLSDNRRAIIQAMAGQGALSVREIAARVERDVHAVYNDVRALQHAGVLDRTEGGWILPYKTIKLEFVLEAVG